MPKKKEREVTFFSPRAKEQAIVVIPVEWLTQETPAGSRTIQSKGKIAQFIDGIFRTSDPEIVAYLTNVYTDKRFPVVRTDIEVNKSGGSKPPTPMSASKYKGTFPGQNA
jgi:hypothetical protein